VSFSRFSRFCLILCCSFLEYAVFSEAGVQATYVGNEGFLISGNGRKILIDSLYREGVPGYVVIPEDQRLKIETGQPPFDAVDLILATHAHPDHFDAKAVAAHLENNPHAFFVSTEQAVKKLEQLPSWNKIGDRAKGLTPKEGERIKLQLNEIEFEVLNLHHGREVPVQNVGFLISVGGQKILHVGDTEATQSELESYKLAEDRIDIAMIPFWHLTEPDRRHAVLNAIQPGRVLVMHVPLRSAKDPYIQELGGWDKMLSKIEKDVPEAVVFRDQMTSVYFK
jgi:L-ascorbate metabolism protein UlaG (beta-lactamase superfamily)